MRTPNRLSVLLSLLAIVILASGGHAQNTVLLDHVDGLNQSGQIMADQPISLYFSFDWGNEDLTCPSNAYRLYSPDGATWSPPTIEATIPMLNMFWDGGVFMSTFSCDGSGSDTLSFTAFTIFQSGLPAGTTDPVYKISFTVDKSQIGKTICVDSSYFPPAGTWLWILPSGNVVPDWGGPYCFDIASCCDGLAGDANLDGSTNVGDVSYLVEFLFLGGPLACVEAGNANGETTGDLVNVADLAWMVAYLFQGGPPPAACH